MSLPEAHDVEPARQAAPAPQRWRLRCPQCARSLRRVRRSQLQRALLGGEGIAHFRRVDASGCGWSGLLARRRRGDAGKHQAAPASVIKAKCESGTGTLLTAADPWDAEGTNLRFTHAALTDKPHEVPTPGTLALSLLALAGLAAFRRRPGRGDAV